VRAGLTARAGTPLLSIRRNIIANYVGQLYATLIGILLVPLYVGYMGVEAYGLDGFYTMLQGWFMLRVRFKVMCHSDASDHRGDGHGARA
jgi:hypothetical protein